MLISKVKPSLYSKGWYQVLPLLGHATNHYIFTTSVVKYYYLKKYRFWVARGSGWQQIGAYVNLGAYYLLGIPVAALLGFLLRFRGKGLQIGILTGSIMQAILLAFITAFTNWQIQVFILAFHLRICFSSPSDLVTKKVKI